MNIYIRIILALIGFVFQIHVVKSMVRKKLSEVHGLLWLAISLVMVVLGIFPNIILCLAEPMGVDYAPALIFTMIDFAFLFAIYVCSKWISQLAARLQELAMQVSLLNQENERIMKRLQKMTGLDKTDI